MAGACVLAGPVGLLGLGLCGPLGPGLGGLRVLLPRVLRAVCWLRVSNTGMWEFDRDRKWLSFGG